MGIAKLKSLAIYGILLLVFIDSPITFKHQPLQAATIEWIQELGTLNQDNSYGISVDGAGNVYISGETLGHLEGINAGGADAWLSKYNPAGVIQWTRQLGTNTTDRSYGVSSDNAGNVYISGYSNGSLGGPSAGSSDAFVSKYNSTGSLQWTRQLGTSGTDVSYGVSTDSFGNVLISGYTTGNLGGSSAGGYDAWVRKYNSSGVIQWTRQLGSTGGDYSNAVSTDNAGNIYISGYTSGSLSGSSAGGQDAFVSKYSPSGNLQWTRQLGSSSSDVSSAVSSDAVGNVYISGYTFGSLEGVNAGNRDAWLSKYDGGGTLQWTRQFGTIYTDEGNGVSVDGMGNVYISGTSLGLAGPSFGSYDAYVRKYDAAGTPLWTEQVGSGYADFGTGITSDGLGNVYLTGYNLKNNDDAFVAKLNSHFTARNSSNWNLASLWNDVAAPTSSDQTFLGGGFTVNVDTAGNATQELTLGHNQFALTSLQGNGTLNIESGGALSVANDLTLGLDGTTGTLLVQGDLQVGGTLTVASGGSGTITVDGGTITGNVIVPDGSVVNGAGTFSNLSIQDGGTASPGNSPGPMSSAVTEWGAGGNYLWEINSLFSDGGIAGTDPGWDLWDTNDLTVSATAGSPFNIILNSLTGANSPGALQNWDSSQSDSWLIATANIGTFDGSALSALTIDSSQFTSYNSLYGGSFSLLPGNGGAGLYLRYSAPVPEPGSFLLLGIGALGLVRHTRRPKQKA